MIEFERCGVVLAPEGGKDSRFAKFNAGMVRHNDVVHMLYRNAENRKPGFDPETQSNYEQDYISYARLDLEGRLLWDSKEQTIFPTFPSEFSGCQDPRIIPFEGAFYIFYCAWDKDLAPAGKDKARVAVARTYNFESYEKLGIINHYTWDKDAFIFPERINGKIAYVHRIAPNIQIDYFDRFEDLVNVRNWAGYESKVEQQTVMRAEFDWECGKIGGSVPPIRTEQGWLFLYHGVEFTDEAKTGADLSFIYHTGAALLDLDDPSILKARIPYPVFSPKEEYELVGDVNNVVFPCGSYEHEGNLYISYGAADKYVALAKVKLSDLLEELNRYPVK